MEEELINPEISRLPLPLDPLCARSGADHPARTPGPGLPSLRSERRSRTQAPSPSPRSARPRPLGLAPAGATYHFSYVRDVDALLSALGLPEVDVIGHSMGAP